jgi:RimJ/RimL family protein N-acetyltransferase
MFMSDTSIKEMRAKFIKERELAFYTDIRAQLEYVSDLKKLGKDAEADAIMDSIQVKLDNRIQEEETRQAADQKREFDRSVFPKWGELFAENDRVGLCVIHEKEKQDYLSLCYDYSLMKSSFTKEEFKEGLWMDFISENTYACTIIDKATESYVGYCSIKDLCKEDWEIAIDLKPAWCHQGYGTDALSLFMNKVFTVTGNRYFRVRVDIDNYASQALMRKLGAYPNGISEFELSGDDLKQFQMEHKDMIDDKIRAVADEFCMEPEDILGYVLEYRFDMADNNPCTPPESHI